MKYRAAERRSERPCRSDCCVGGQQTRQFFFCSGICFLFSLQRFLTTSSLSPNVFSLFLIPRVSARLHCFCSIVVSANRLLMYIPGIWEMDEGETEIQRKSCLFWTFCDIHVFILLSCSYKDP